jgi:hypothetical protein
MVCLTVLPGWLAVQQPSGHVCHRHCPDFVISTFYFQDKSGSSRIGKGYKYAARFRCRCADKRIDRENLACQTAVVYIAHFQRIFTGVQIVNILFN